MKYVFLKTPAYYGTSNFPCPIYDKFSDEFGIYVKQ